MEARLGELVQLGRRAVVARLPEGPREKAQIVFFTGVRYQRESAPVLPGRQDSTVSGKRRR